MLSPNPDMMPIEVTVIAESVYTVFVTMEPDKKFSIPKEYCTTGDGKYPKNFELNKRTTLMVSKWYYQSTVVDV